MFSKRKISYSWIAYLFIVISVFVLYGLDKMNEYIFLLRTIIAILPIVLCLFLSIVWAINSDKGKTQKVIAGIVSGIITAAFVYYRYLEEIMEWIKGKQETITITALSVILIVSVGLAKAAASSKAA